MKGSKLDVTSGSIPKGILRYAVPLMFSTLLQYLFNAVDIAVLGNMADTAAVAAVGATSSIISVIMSGFVGFSSGCKIILARQIGEGDEERVKKTVDTSMISAAAIGVLLSVIGFFLAPLFLNWTSCPADCIDASKLYMRIYLLSAPAIMLYNFGSSVLISIGDTKRPLYYITTAGAVNVGLNVVLCLLLREKVIAVAIATLASQVVSAVLVCRRLMKMDGLGKLILRKMKWHSKTFFHIVGLGAPLSLSHLLGPISDLQIQSGINAIGVEAVAGNSAGISINNLIHSFANPIGTATITFMGQNIGAGKRERVKQTLFYCFVIGFAVTTAVSLFFYFTRGLWFGIILKDNALAIEYASFRLLVITTFYLPHLVTNVMGHLVQVYGYTGFYSVVNIINVLGFRMLWMQVIHPVFFAETEHAFLSCMLCIMLAIWLQAIIMTVFGLRIHTRFVKYGIRKKE